MCRAGSGWPDVCRSRVGRPDARSVSRRMSLPLRANKPSDNKKKKEVPGRAWADSRLDRELLKQITKKKKEVTSKVSKEQWYIDNSSVASGAGGCMGGGRSQDWST